jgi:hypothetical protein
MLLLDAKPLLVLIPDVVQLPPHFDPKAISCFGVLSKPASLENEMSGSSTFFCGSLEEPMGNANGTKLASYCLQVKREDGPDGPPFILFFCPSMLLP